MLGAESDQSAREQAGGYAEPGNAAGWRRVRSTGNRAVGRHGDTARRLADRQSRRRSAGSAAGPPARGAYVRPRHFPWAELLRRTFEIDILACPGCGGRLRLVATIEDHVVIEKILAHLGLPVDPPTAAPARSPDWLPRWSDRASESRIQAPPCWRALASRPAAQMRHLSLRFGPDCPNRHLLSMR